MMKTYKKRDFPVDQIRRFLEPGLIVLVNSAWKSQMNIMTRVVSGRSLNLRRKFKPEML
jgi:hypothetical protein